MILLLSSLKVDMAMTMRNYEAAEIHSRRTKKLAKTAIIFGVIFTIFFVVIPMIIMGVMLGKASREEVHFNTHVNKNYDRSDYYNRDHYG